MRNKVKIITITGIILLLTNNALAGNAGQAGIIGGAAGGAILGQAIGRDTQGTLLGTAIGGVLGYIIGNEMDKQLGYPGGTIQRMTAPLPYPERADSPGTGYHRSLESEGCRPVEILATIDGRPERVNTLACPEAGEWVVRGEAGRMVERIVILEPHRVHRLPMHPRFRRAAGRGPYPGRHRNGGGYPAPSDRVKIIIY